MWCFIDSWNCNTNHRAVVNVSVCVKSSHSKSLDSGRVRRKNKFLTPSDNTSSPSQLRIFCSCKNDSFVQRWFDASGGVRPPSFSFEHLTSNHSHSNIRVAINSDRQWKKFPAKNYTKCSTFSTEFGTNEGKKRIKSKRNHRISTIKSCQLKIRPLKVKVKIYRWTPHIRTKRNTYRHLASFDISRTQRVHGKAAHNKNNSNVHIVDRRTNPNVALINMF